MKVRDLGDRLKESAPLLAIGIAFLAGAVAASLDRTRLFASSYPLWILLAANGGIAAAAGSLSVFVTDPDRPIDDDPNIVRVPRAQWESLLRRLELVRQSATDRFGGPNWSEPGVAPPAAPASLPPPIPGRVESPVAAASSVDAPAPLSRSSALRMELDSLEVQGLAESALATADALGPAEFHAMLANSGEELTGVAVRWSIGGPAERDQAKLLARLVREIARRPELQAGRRTVDELRDFADRLDRVPGPEPTASPPPGATMGGPEPLGTPADEVEALLQELESGRAVGKKSTGTPPSDEKRS